MTLAPEEIRLPSAAVWLVLLLAWESASPFFDFFRANLRRRGLHALRNLFLGAANTLLVSAGFVWLWMLTAAQSEARGIGLLHRVGLPPGWQVLLAVLLLDVWTYWWHRFNHEVPFLWRMHRVHHSDPNMDVTTANRFHIGEIFFSSLFRVPLILFIGIRLTDLLWYEVFMFAVVQFHHANIGLHPCVDRFLRIFIVTPAMHKVHHSRLQPETDSNYTALLSVWDRLFGTFRLRVDPHAISFGLDEYDVPRRQSIPGLFATPFFEAKASDLRANRVVWILLGFAVLGLTILWLPA